MIVHPQETIVDHTKGGSIGGGSNVEVDVQVSVNEDGKWEARVSQIAAGKAQQTVGRYDQGLPARMREINRDPKRIS